MPLAGKKDTQKMSPKFRLLELLHLATENSSCLLELASSSDDEVLLRKTLEGTLTNVHECPPDNN